MNKLHEGVNSPDDACYDIKEDFDENLVMFLIKLTRKKEFPWSATGQKKW